MSLEKTLTFEDLQSLTGYTRRADIERSLSAQGIKFFYGKNGPWTTIDLINYAGGIRAGSDEKYGAEIIGDIPKNGPELRLS